MDSPNRPNHDRPSHPQDPAQRLQELEAELFPPTTSSVQPTHPSSSVTHRAQSLPFKTVLKAIKFLAIVVAVVVAVRVALWLATALVVAGLAWVVYTLFFANDRA